MSDTLPPIEKTKTVTPQKVALTIALVVAAGTAGVLAFLPAATPAPDFDSRFSEPCRPNDMFCWCAQTAGIDSICDKHCLENPGDDACAVACEHRPLPRACSGYCAETPGSDMCTRLCMEAPGSAICAGICVANTAADNACMRACDNYNLQETRDICDWYCQSRPSDQLCKRACEVDRQSPACKAFCRVNPRDMNCRARF